ncbi:uncharacterized protein Dwil_GK26908, partial [Drosophila willistoni]
STLLSGHDLRVGTAKKDIESLDSDCLVMCTDIALNER